MNTQDLISALVADNGSTERPIGESFARAILIGAFISLAIFFLWIHPRRDLMEAAGTLRVLFKFLVTTLLAVSAFGLAVRLSRPGAGRGRWGHAWLAAPALLIVAVGVELTVLPSSLWLPRLIGVNARYCLVLIPLLALGPLAALLWGLRQGAPTQPKLAGAVAGLAAGGIAAAIYAAHCTDDSPLFVAVWYSIAIGLVTAAGATIGARVLRW